jgi:hypothetical protein
MGHYCKLLESKKYVTSREWVSNSFSCHSSFSSPFPSPIFSSSSSLLSSCGCLRFFLPRTLEGSPPSQSLLTYWESALEESCSQMTLPSGEDWKFPLAIAKDRLTICRQKAPSYQPYNSINPSAQQGIIQCLS